MSAPLAIDIHAHFFPESFLRVVETDGARFGGSVDRSNPRGPVLAAGGARTPPLDPTYYDVDRRVRAMDRVGVAHAVMRVPQRGTV